MMRTTIENRRRGSKKQATTTATTACLHQDVLASILIRLPGARRVCKEWRDIIADPTFIHAHMIHGPRGPPCLTHTIVFFPGFTYGSRQDPRYGRGFLFDEHWRFTAELTAGVWDDLVGACNGLLCFLEAGQHSIKVVEPFTGESLALRQPTPLRRNINPSAYCFGYDATSRRHKIVFHGLVEDGARHAGEAIDDEELHVYTVGGGNKQGWRRLHIACSVYGRAYGDPVYAQGSVYWPTRGEREQHKKLVRFDLAAEKITVEAAVQLRLKPRAPVLEKAKFSRLVDSMPCVMTYGRYGQWDAWFPQAEQSGAGDLPGPGGHVLLQDYGKDGGLYLRWMERSLEFGPRKLLLGVGKKKKKQSPGSRYYDQRGASFVPARHHRQLPIAGAPPPREQCYARTFGYVPTVSAAPLALYLGMPSP